MESTSVGSMPSHFRAMSFELFYIFYHKIGSVSGCSQVNFVLLVPDLKKVPLFHFIRNVIQAALCLKHQVAPNVVDQWVPVDQFLSFPVNLWYFLEVCSNSSHPPFFLRKKPTRWLKVDGSCSSSWVALPGASFRDRCSDIGICLGSCEPAADMNWSSTMQNWGFRLKFEVVDAQAFPYLNIYIYIS